MNPTYMGNLNNIFSQLNIDTTKFNDFDACYCFEDKVNSGFLPKEMLKEFIYNYALSIKRLLAMNDSLERFQQKEVDLFTNWLNSKGLPKIEKMVQELKDDGIVPESLLKVLLYYDFLLNEAVENQETDELLNWLYDIPVSLYNKLKALGYIIEEVGHYSMDYGNIKNSDYNCKISKPANTQAFLHKDISGRGTNVKH